MRVWRRTRTEAAGAWRSLRYDMGRRPSDPPAGGPDVTSTGMNTFGGTSWGFGPEPTEMPVAGRMPAPRRRSPRRAVAVSALGLLTVVGAAGAYLVVVNGLVPMRDEGPAAAATLPPATGEAGLGPSTKSPRALRITSATDPAPAIVPPRPAQKPALKPGPAPEAPRKAIPFRTINPTTPECGCDHPPVPTPTAPASAPSATPSAPASPSTSASSSDADPTDERSESPEPRKNQKHGHHRRHH
jgi:hypothetical protein